MNHAIELDDLDRELIRILELNSRMSYRKIAERLRVSPATVLVRLRKLRRKGIIKGFTVDLDPTKLGYTAQAIMLIKTEPKKMKLVANKLASLPNAVEIYEVTGEYHVLVKIWAEDQNSLAKLIDLISGIEGIRDFNIVYILKVVKEARSPL
ncbi:MAG: Lrp/AsnC family transcriptional regulator [Desulfurococcales archaeon]|nr:Lrp/AsnC family transcriptional regulator [Desulfurococcales archaeon]